MDQSRLWQRYQDWLYYHAGLGFYLDVSRMAFDDAFIEQTTPKFAHAFSQMAALEGGAIANPDEHRQVGHYWLRDPELAPDPATRQEIIATLDDIEQFVQAVVDGDIHPPGEARFTDILSIGIGGSALGPQFVSDAIAPDHPRLDDPLHRQHRSGRYGPSVGAHR